MASACARTKVFLHFVSPFVFNDLEDFTPPNKGSKRSDGHDHDTAGWREVWGIEFGQKSSSIFPPEGKGHILPNRPLTQRP